VSEGSPPRASALVLGIGCQRGTSAALLARGIEHTLRGLDLDIDRVTTLATVAKKRDEVGLLQLARARGWALVLHDDLGEGVAEPAARRHGRLLMGKRIYREPNVEGSMTIAVAEVER
jgi:cobalt-precorrin 5A hydrolase/precorrin-3B C17-methyltransferase